LSLLMYLVAHFVLAFAAAVALVPACRRIALRFDYVAVPKRDRWHRKRAALLGGVAVAVVVLAGGLTIRPLSDVALLLVAGLAAAAIGLVDDIVVLRPATKLVAQIVLASTVVYSGYRLYWLESMTADAMLTLMWIVGVTNALNLLDNMDGLAAGIAIIVALTLMAGFLDSGGSRSYAAYLALLIGALGGFLIYNFNPASIFMGDSGSLFIGFTLATLTLQPAAGHKSGPGVLAVIGAPLMVLLIPIFDTALVTIARLLSGRNPGHGGRDHSSHRLVAIGLSERRAVSVLWMLAAIGGLLAFAFRKVPPDVAAPMALAFVLAMVIFAVYLARVKVYDEPDEQLLASGRVTPVVVGFMHKRRAAEVLLDFCLVPLAYYTAYRLRFEGPEFVTFFPVFLSSLPIVVGLQISALFIVGGYRGLWRYFGLMDGVVFTKAVLLGTAMIVVAIVYLFRFEHYSRAVFVIYAALLMLALIGSRASFRLISEFVQRRQSGRRLVIYGAGDGGSIVCRELMTSKTEQYGMVGFIDDDPAKHKTRVHGFAVIGGLDALTQLIAAGGVDDVVISIREIELAKVKHLEELCSREGVTLRRIQLTLEPIVAS
jgi:UDP-GlcNAc:undecaprenyl-phosphate GlcNAc-1-phosphate transferase